jgi:hypothetical protein
MPPINVPKMHPVVRPRLQNEVDNMIFGPFLPIKAPSAWPRKPKKDYNLPIVPKENKGERGCT